MHFTLKPKDLTYPGKFKKPLLQFYKFYSWLKSFPLQQTETNHIYTLRDEFLLQF